jgi:hypothetical protein
MEIIRMAVIRKQQRNEDVVLCKKAHLLFQPLMATTERL